MMIITLAIFLIVFGCVFLIGILSDNDIEDVIWLSLASAGSIALATLGLCLLMKVIT